MRIHPLASASANSTTRSSMLAAALFLKKARSFDYLTDTYLPGMRFGWNFLTCSEIYAWRSYDDSAPGEFCFHLDPSGYPQILHRRGNAVGYRYGPWDGIWFSTQDSTFDFLFMMNENEVYFYFTEPSIHRALMTRFNANYNGVAQRVTWVVSRGWMVYVNLPAVLYLWTVWCIWHLQCWKYSVWMLGRFVPRNPERWFRADWTSGCVRRTYLSCEEDVFLTYSRIKLPDTRFSWYNMSMTLQECREECLRNCSCTAYTKLNISRRSGCLIWYKDLIDIRSSSSDEQDIYIRMASFRRKKKNDIKMREGLYDGSHQKDSDLPLFNLYTILEATNNFSSDNKPGEGGFGPVYKEGGQEIAVKQKHVYLLGKKCVHIINGVARGLLLYLHQDSRLRIIHRDLEASNVLLIPT
ncbi:hypothetical protein RD792_002774 [Penstemon davidsonii]|uniref:Apple domain-containing protein n=1 Tax=Penstemon davidsonii TaxID=160366 RepID=A0ABR0DRW1_9LAMI|nr:hypothetical protein RD792_002774 [Penstemon davidsonii]